MIVRRLPSNELYHHGIKGQKWGVRLYQNPDGSLTPAGKARYGTAKNFNEVQRRKKKLDSRRNLSSQELRERVNRLKLEQEYKRLSEADIKPGKKFCDTFLNDFGKTILTSVATGATLFALNALITKEIDPRKAADYIAPSPKGKGRK